MLHHFNVERGIANRLKAANREERKAIYATMYDELFSEVPDHPRLTRRADPIGVMDSDFDILLEQPADMNITTINRREYLIAAITLFAAGFLFASYYWIVRPPPVPSSDGYERYALVLAESGVFGKIQGQGGKPIPNFGRAPLYPAFLAVIIKLDDGYHEYLRCYYAGKGRECSPDVISVQIVQVLFIIFGGFLIHLISRHLGAGNWESLFFSVLAIFILMKIGAIVRYSEGVALPLFIIVSYGLTRWFASKGNVLIVLSLGISLGLLMLARPTYLFLLPVVAFVLLIFPDCEKSLSLGKRAKFVFLLLVCSGIIIGPWLIRNYNLSGRVIITDAGVFGTLSTRAQYNKMGVLDAAVGMVYWVPVVGDRVAKALFPEERWRKFDDTTPESYRLKALRRRRELVRTMPNRAQVKIKLMEEVMANPAQHLWVSIPLAWRGMNRVFPMIPFALIFVVVMIRKKKWWVFGALTATLFNLFFYAGFSHFIPRYGYPMVSGFAPAAAFGLMYAMGWMKRNIPKFMD